MTRERAEREYDALLEGDLFAESRRLFDARVRTDGITRGGRAICETLRPGFVGHRDVAKVDGSAQIVVRVLDSLYDRARRDRGFAATLGLCEWELALGAVERTPPPPLVGRLDAFLTTDAVKFIEYNTTPACLLHLDLLASAFEATPIWREFCRTWVCERDSIVARALNALLASGLRPRSLALFDPTAGGNTRELEQIIQVLSNLGIATRGVTDRDDWRCVRDRLFVNDTVVDAIAFVDPADLVRMTSECGIDHAMFRALGAGTLTFIGGMFRSVLCRSKAVFAALSNPSIIDARYPHEIRRALRAVIPWSRIVADHHTDTPDGHRDLVPWVRRCRERLVLKPVHAQGGRGIVLGWEATANEWEAALATALATTGAMVVQERVAIPTKSCPMLTGRGVEHRMMAWDYNPFAWAGVVGEGCSRISPRSLLNVSSGHGHIVPAYRVRPR